MSKDLSKAATVQFKSVICDSKLMTVERPGDWSAHGVSVRTEEASSA